MMIMKLEDRFKISSRLNKLSSDFSTTVFNFRNGDLNFEEILIFWDIVNASLQGLRSDIEALKKLEKRR